ncbi:hypothetical protein [Chromobacterium amazonense]|uniref:Uncharacterized protein n=1 Tax=Chromobacterium amazonense TaxID=1382803 RepID=A0ABU8V2E8_9NEIS|nr:hypothetical protein [Chromobacterium amazonense]MDQ4539267.1 hypothetical protein [Chromobacterium amazonense]
MITNDHRTATDKEVEFLEFFADKFAETTLNIENSNVNLSHFSQALSETKSALPDELAALFGDE